MGQIIDFKNLSIPKDLSNGEKTQNRIHQFSDNSVDQGIDSDSALSLLLKTYNGKFTYSMKECAEILGLSYEFIRRQVQSKRIASTKYGDRKMISIIELAKIITKGV